MRAYFFQNFYLQGIHAGIQSQHTTAEMFAKYCINGKDFSVSHSSQLFDWAQNHKTTIVLNGGMQENLEDLYYFLGMDENPYPFAKFHEADFSLNGALTNVGIILPDAIYNTAADLRRYKKDGWCMTEDENGALRVVRDAKGKVLPMMEAEKGVLFETYTPWQHELMQRMNRCGLMN